MGWAMALFALSYQFAFLNFPLPRCIPGCSQLRLKLRSRDAKQQVVVKQSQQQEYTGRKGAKKIPFFLVPKDYAGYTIYRVGFHGLDQRGSPVPRHKESNTVLCPINTGLSMYCNKSDLPVLLGVKLLQEFFKLTCTSKDASYRAFLTQAGSSYGSKTGNKPGYVRPTSTLWWSRSYFPVKLNTLY